jgi:hypothetical protein
MNEQNDKTHRALILPNEGPFIVDLRSETFKKVFFWWIYGAFLVGCGCGWVGSCVFNTYILPWMNGGAR